MCVLLSYDAFGIFGAGTKFILCLYPSRMLCMPLCLSWIRRIKRILSQRFKSFGHTLGVFNWKSWRRVFGKALFNTRCLV